jgi:hypothetical protein
MLPRLANSPQNRLKQSLLVLLGESAFYDTIPVAFSIIQSTYQGDIMSGLGHPRRYVKHQFSRMNKAIRDRNPYLLPCMKCDVAEIRN